MNNKKYAQNQVDELNVQLLARTNESGSYVLADVPLEFSYTGKVQLGLYRLQESKFGLGRTLVKRTNTPLQMAVAVEAMIAIVRSLKENGQLILEVSNA